VNRDPDQYGATADQHDAAMVLYLVELLLLERCESEFPSTQADETMKTMETWHIVARAMLDGMAGDPPGHEAHPRPSDSDE
jgi:hypothetical protein